MTIDLDKLEAAVRKAQQDAPGPYKVEWLNDNEIGSSHIGINRIVNANGDDVVIADSGVYPPYGATARHIDVVLALIAEVRALRGEVEALSNVYGAAAVMRTFPVPFAEHWDLVGAVDECRAVIEPPIDDYARARKAKP